MAPSDVTLDNPGRHELYVIESIGLDPFLFLWLARACFYGHRVLYASGRPRVIQWWRKRFPPGDFEELVSEFYQTGKAHLELYDWIEGRAQRIGRSFAARRLQRFFTHPRTTMTLRRWLMQDVFDQWIVSMEVERRLAVGEAVRFFPSRQRPCIRDRCAAAWAAVPSSYCTYLTSKECLTGALIPFMIAAGLIVRAVQDRGLSFRHPRAIQQWKVAQKIAPRLHKGRIPDHELLYADGDLHPTRILHIVDETDIAQEAKEHYDSLGVTVVRAPCLTWAAAYFTKRGLWDYLVKLVLGSVPAAVSSRNERELLRAAAKIGWQIINCEVFLQHYQIGAYFTWDTYAVLCNVRTMVWEQAGTRCVGYIHGSPPMALSYYHGVYVHTLLVAGERIRDMFGRTLEAVGQIVVIGHMHTEIALGLRQDSPHPGHVVLAFDTSFAPVWGYSKDTLFKFYLGLLALVEAFPEITLYLKRKYENSFQPNSAYAEVEALLEQHPRIKVVYERDAYSLLAEADSVVAIAASTTGIEALACRKPAVFFDPRLNYADNPYGSYHRFLVCHTADELVGRYAHILAGDYPTGAIEAVVRRESKFCDERPLSCVRQLILAQAGLAFKNGDEA